MYWLPIKAITTIGGIVTQKIFIIGAGPAGLLLAHYLLDRGNYQVEIYERRQDPRQLRQSTQRTFPISLQLRGLQAIQAIPGLEEQLVAKGVWAKGAVLHRKQGEPRNIDRQTPLLLIDRNQLVQQLLHDLQKRHGNDVLIQFDYTCEDVNWREQTVTLKPRYGSPFSTGFDRLVAADGARSQVRDVLVAAGDMTCDQETVPDVYKSLFVRRTSPDGMTELAADRIHTWSLGTNKRLLLAPQPDDWLHGTLIFPPQDNPLEPLTSAADVLTYLQTRCPPLGELMTLENAETLRQRPVSTIQTVRCDRMNVGDRIVLLGDAAHAVSPSVGQGCNAALQDVQIFNQLLDEYQDDWSQALPAFTTQRLPEAHALRDLSDYSFPRSKLMSLEFILRLTLGKKLSQWFPPLADSWGKPLPMEMLMETELPYSEVLHQNQDWINRVRRSMRP